jgi:hypothetical protein
MSGVAVNATATPEQINHWRYFLGVVAPASFKQAGPPSASGF